MASRTKKTTSNQEEVTATPVENKSTNNQPSEKQSQMATILVGLLIIASGLLIYNYFQRTSTPEVTNQNQQEQSEQDQNDNGDNVANENQDGSEDQDQSEGEQDGRYTVQPGDSLWSIAEGVYGDGHQWRRIADANQLSNNASGQPTVNAGQELNVPDSAATDERPAIGSTGDADGKAVAGVQDIQETPSTAIETYTVQSGDTLWSIAEQFYGDGDQWELIYSSPLNELGSLDNGTPLVHAGNVLVIPDLL